MKLIKCQAFNKKHPVYFYALTIPKSCSGNKRGKKSLLPEQKWIDGYVHARAVDDIISEHTST